MKQSQVLGLTFVIALSFSMSLALATAKSEATSIPKVLTCQSQEKVELKGQDQFEFEVQLTRKSSARGVVKIKRIKGSQLEKASIPVSLVQTDGTTRGYLPGFIIARNQNLSLSINLQKKPFRASLWVPDLGERDGVLLRCR